MVIKIDNIDNVDIKKLEKMINEDKLEYPLLSNEDNIERMEKVILILKNHKDELKEIKDKEKNFYMRRKYQSMIDSNNSLINFIAVRTLGE